MCWPGSTSAAQGVWAFARPGAPPLKFNESLDDAGVVDGSLLTLVSVSRTERYRPLVEDVIDAIAVLDESPEFDRTALNRFVGLAIPFAALAVTIMSLVAWSRSGQDWWWAVALGVLGLGLLGGSAMATNRYQNIDMAESLLVAALPTLAGAVALAVPLPQGYGSLGAPQVAGAAAVVLLLTLATRGGPRKRAELSSFFAVASIAATAAAIAFGYGWQYWVPAGAVAFGLIVVTNAAKLTVAVARIALPPIPAPGETVGSEELLDPVATPDGDESPTWQAIIESVPDSAARLHERSQLARRLLIGFVTAGALILSIGAIAVVVQGHFFVHSMIVAGLGDIDLRLPIPALRRAVVCLGVVGGGCHHPDRRDGETVAVVSRPRVAGARHLHGSGDRGVDRHRRGQQCAAGVAGDQADPGTA